MIVPLSSPFSLLHPKRFFMKSIQQILAYGSLLLLMLVIASCGTQPQQKVEETSIPPSAAKATPAVKAPHMNSTVLPVEYQRPKYTLGNEVSQDNKDLTHSDVIMKVGASIHSTAGPQPLRDIIKRLAALKGMNISWASDVDQSALVDVDINANDDFNDAIDNLLRQINYFHEIKGNTIFIKNKVTRQWHLAMPFIRQQYETDTGGDVLGSSADNNAFKGKISVKASGSPTGSTAFDTNNSKNSKSTFDLWENVENNLKVILDILETSETAVSSTQREFGGTGQYQGAYNQQEGSSSTNATGNASATRKEKSNAAGQEKLVKTSRQTSKTGAYFTIDKPVGIITVTATRDLLDKVDKYITSLKRELYKQVNIEAKVIEVQLTKNEDYGINWSKVLKNFGVTGTATFGVPNSSNTAGQVWPNPTSQSFISTISLNNATFNVFLNALKEQGTTKVLSSPKISVMNGEPAFITVGRNTTYISKVTSTESTSGAVPTTSYTVDTSSILSGVGLALTANIMDNNEVVLNLVPVTSTLQSPIEYKDFGLNSSGQAAASVGLPVVDVREMSTTVRVKNGEMLIIGGLINNTDKKDGQFAPILGDIPILKYLFGYKSNSLTKNELIILLKPTVL
jgi:general secretion pathway protein D/MSHA biogenesis protein MshL